MNNDSGLRPETQAFLESRRPFSLPGVGDFHHVCTFPADWSGTGRPSAADATHVPGVWLDLDVGKTLPDIDQCHRWLDLIQEQPTFRVETGGGVHAYWLWGDEDDGELLPPPESPEVAAIEAAHGAADDGLRTLPARFVAWARGDLYEYCRDQRNDLMAWTPTLDSVGDLARIMRSPGSMNPKYDPPRPVRVTHDDGPRYVPSDFYWVPAMPTLKGVPVKLENCDYPQSDNGAAIRDSIRIGSTPGPAGGACPGDSISAPDALQLLELLLEMDPPLAALYNADPRVLKKYDDDDSRIDMALLALFLHRFRSHVKRIELAAYLARRARRGRVGDDKCDRADYWSRSIQTALRDSPAIGNPTAEVLPAAAEDLLHDASDMLGVPLSRVIHVSGVGTYILEFGDGTPPTSLAPGSLSPLGGGRSKFYASLSESGIAAVPVDAKLWPVLSQTLIRSATSRHDGEASSPEGLLYEAIARLITSATIHPQVALMHRGIMQIPKGRHIGLHQSANPAKSGLRIRFSDVLSTLKELEISGFKNADVATWLRAVGGRPITSSPSDGSLPLWHITGPLHELAREEFALIGGAEEET